MKKPGVPLYYITAGWLLLTVFMGLYFLFNGMKPSADVEARLQSNIHRISVGEMAPGDVNQFQMDRRPIVIWRRNNAEIARAMALLDPATSPEEWLAVVKDGTLALELGADKFARLECAEWFIVSPINTGGIGCVVLTKAGDYRGFFDPCQGAHFDLWGHLQKGPTPEDLKVVPMNVSEDGQSVLIDLTEVPTTR